MSFWIKSVVLIVCFSIYAVFRTTDIFQETSDHIKRSLDNLFSTKTESQDELGKYSEVPQIYSVLSKRSDTLYTKDKLSKYDGSAGSPGLYLAILGRVYDVAVGEKHYGEGGGYSFFRARDGTKAFMTGEFNDEGLIDEVTGLTYTQMLELEDWIKFYDKTYTYKGKLVGNFYNDEGEPTEALLEAVEEIKGAHVKKLEAQKERARMPPCNSQQKEGFRRVWCTKQSGGVKRDWVGVPRMLYKQGSAAPRCVCVKPEDLTNPQLKQYENCHPQAESCQLEPFKPKQEL